VSRRGWILAGLLVALSGCAYVVIGVVATEAQGSRFQARYLAKLAREMTYSMQPGPSDSIRFPHSGPYDARLGYEDLPRYLDRLEAHGYVPLAQTRMSPELVNLMDKGIFPPYREKNQAGLALLDCNARTLSFSRYPERQYEQFTDVPPLLVRSLLFVENQNLLNPEYPTLNPALEWKRLSRAVLDQALRLANRGHATPGGSTLATQIEKYRHSPEGRTQSIPEKFRQIASASLRAYQDGPDTQKSRERIVVDYLNTVPLSARHGYGEINGIGDALWVWYGEDFDEVNALIRDTDQRNPSPREAKAFKRALSLIISQRRPSYHLRRDDTNLDALTNSYLRLMTQDGIITGQLRDAALAQALGKASLPDKLPGAPFVTRKAVNRVRADLSSLTGVTSGYDLDRLDLTADTSINREAQRTVTDALRRMQTKESAHEMGLYGKNLLQEKDDPSKLIASFTLFERVGNASLVRVQADNIDKPFDLNNGARLNLGSTAKLRTVVTYLEIVQELHDRYSAMDKAELAHVQVARQDNLTRWALDYLASAKTPDDRKLGAMLEAAMQRKYSGNAGEAFFTGGGQQVFTNFEKWEGERQMTVRVAFQHSVNLVFVRMMRDIVRYEVFHDDPSIGKLLEDRNAPERREYLERFADQEGSAYMVSFYQRYRGKASDERLQVLLGRIRPTTNHLNAVRTAVALLSARPELDEESFERIMIGRLTEKKLVDEDLPALYGKYGHDKFHLNDRGYISRVHPLELWIVEYLGKHPDATLKETLDASKAERQFVYKWLFKTRSTFGQNNRIRTLLERDAFDRVAKRWQRLGYPFDSITPSYASAIGAAGDRPAALAELAGIILNDGRQAPIYTVRKLEFAIDTPYATQMGQSSQPGKQLIAPEIAELVKRSMRDVVQAGTARSILGSIVSSSGNVIPVAGKTGTGDQQYKVWGPGGSLIQSRTISRSATFVFLLGERFFGTLTVYVGEPDARKYSFTSALAVRTLRALGPQVAAMVTDDPRRAELRCHDVERTLPAPPKMADGMPGETTGDTAAQAPGAVPAAADDQPAPVRKS
jgi:membrane peptidoglycan carboxypeptidase